MLKKKPIFATRTREYKFVRGNVISSLDELVKYDGFIVMYGNTYRYQTSGWIRSWQIHYAYSKISRGEVFVAERNDK